MSDKVYRWRSTVSKDGSLQWVEEPPYNKNEAFRKFEPEQKGIRYGQATSRHMNTVLTPDEVAMVGDASNHISEKIQVWHNHCAGQIGKDLNQTGEEKISSRDLFSTIKHNFGKAELDSREKYLNRNKQLLTEADQARRDLNAFRGECPNFCV